MVRLRACILKSPGSSVLFTLKEEGRLDVLKGDSSSEFFKLDSAAVLD